MFSMKSRTFNISNDSSSLNKISSSLSYLLQVLEIDNV